MGQTIYFPKSVKMKEASELKPILKAQPTEKELRKSLLKANLFFLPVFLYFGAWGSVVVKALRY